MQSFSTACTPASRCWTVRFTGLRKSSALTFVPEAGASATIQLPTFRPSCKSSIPASANTWSGLLPGSLPAIVDTTGIARSWASLMASPTTR